MEPPISLNSQFGSMAALKRACSNFAIQYHFEFQVRKANKLTYTIVCKQIDCPWRLYAATIKDTPLVSIRTRVGIRSDSTGIQPESGPGISLLRIGSCWKILYPTRYQILDRTDLRCTGSCSVKLKKKSDRTSVGLILGPDYPIIR